MTEMKLTFRKEIGPRNKASINPIGFIYRCLEKPEFTICAEGMEWAADRYFQWPKDFPVGTEIAMEIRWLEMNRPDVECSACHGTGKIGQ
jgi:hypothetical protein